MKSNIIRHLAEPLRQQIGKIYQARLDSTKRHQAAESHRLSDDSLPPHPRKNYSADDHRHELWLYWRI